MTMSLQSDLLGLLTAIDRLRNESSLDRQARWSLNANALRIFSCHVIARCATAQSLRRAHDVEVEVDYRRVTGCCFDRQLLCMQCRLQYKIHDTYHEWVNECRMYCYGMAFFVPPPQKKKLHVSYSFLFLFTASPRPETRLCDRKHLFYENHFSITHKTLFTV